MVVRSQAIGVVVGFLVLVVLTQPASAVIRVDVPLTMIFKSSQDVLISKVRSVDAGEALARLHQTVRIEELNKKVLLPRDRKLTLDLAADKSISEKLHPGMPVVIFAGRRGAAFHVAGTWYKASRGENADWRITEPYDIARTFPGTTASLIRALLKIRAGQAPLVDGVMHHTWHGNFKLQALDVTGKTMAAADADGDGKADLILATDQGVRFYRGRGPRQPFVEATAQWGLVSATARQIAFADADGDRKPDLLLDELYVNSGSGFVPSQAEIDLRDRNVLAVSLMDMTGDDRPEALILERDATVTVYRNPGKDVPWPRLLRRQLWEDGKPPLAAHFGDWGEGRTPHVMVIRESGLIRYSLSGEAADHFRLTGEKPWIYRGQPRFFPMTDYQASTAWDRNGGDGNLDLLISTRQGGPKDLELVGRGHGAFFTNTEGSVRIEEVRRDGRGWRRQPLITAMTPADMYGDGSFEMLVLEENGDLWQMDSPIYVRGSPIGEWKE